MSRFAVAEPSTGLRPTTSHPVRTVGDMRTTPLPSAMVLALVLATGCSDDPAADEAGASASPAPPTTTDVAETSAPTTTSPPATTALPTTTASTTTTITPTTTEPADPCADAVETAEELVIDLLDEIDQGVADVVVPDEETFEQVTTASSLIVEGCVGDELGDGVSRFIAILSNAMADEDRTEIARSSAGSFLDVLCDLDEQLLDDDAAAACEERALATAPTAEQYREAFITVWDDGFRGDLVEALGSSNDIESVDFLDFDAETDTVVIDVTSRWASPGNQVDGAWGITRTLAILWKDGSVLGDPTWSAGLRLVNSGTAYTCTSDFMQRLADARAARSDWEAECAT